MSERSQIPHTLILRLSDRTGAMELIAATFAHRGLSLSWTLGNDGSLAPDGFATVIVHFSATMARKEAVKRVLSRLSRVVSVTEPAANGTAIRMSALVRLMPSTPAPTAEGVQSEWIATDPETAETIYSLVGEPDCVSTLLTQLRQQNVVRTLTVMTLAL